MVKKLILGIGLYGISCAAMELPEPLLETALWPTAEFDQMADRLKAHLLSYGQARDTAAHIDSMNQFCQQNQLFFGQEFYRQFAQLKVHELLGAAYTPQYLWREYVKNRIKNQQEVSENEVKDFTNANVNCSLIATFCNQIMARAQ